MNLTESLSFLDSPQQATNKFTIIIKAGPSVAWLALSAGIYAGGDLTFCSTVLVER